MWPQSERSVFLSFCNSRLTVCPLLIYDFRTGNTIYPISPAGRKLFFFLLFLAAETVLWHTSAAEIMKGMEEEGKLLTPTGDTNLADLSN